MTPKRPSAPLNDSIIIAVSQLVDDAQAADRRDPSHSDLETCIQRAGLAAGDPNLRGSKPIGKTKRIRGTLSWAMEHDPEAGGALVAGLIELIRGYGGFREASSNYTGRDAIESAVAAFDGEGYELGQDGVLRPRLLGNLSGVELTDALKLYVRRAKRGSADAALIAGIGKDLLEAVATHILQERFGGYSSTSNFPTLLGQAFVALEMATPQHPPKDGEPPAKAIERAMYQLACAINRLRKKEGTGHGRPWLPTVTDAEARTAIESMGIISERLLLLHQGVK